MSKLKSSETSNFSLTVVLKMLSVASETNLMNSLM